MAGAPTEAPHGALAPPPTTTGLLGIDPVAADSPSEAAAPKSTEDDTEGEVAGQEDGAGMPRMSFSIP